MSEAKKQKIMEEEKVTMSKDPHHRRTLRFILSLAAETLFGDRTLSGGHAVGEAYWFSFDRDITADSVEALEKAMRELIAKNLPITACEKSYVEVMKSLEFARQPFAAALLSSRVKASVPVHVCGSQLRLKGSELYASTGLVTGPFKLYFAEGCVLMGHSDNYRPQAALLASIGDHKLWDKNCSGIQCVGQLNLLEVMPHNTRKKFILESEFRQEQKLCEIANLIAARGGKIRALCIAGPTSSGKTTFANKLAMYLKNFGFEAKALTVDHYYHSIEEQPKFKVRGERNDVNYDHLESMDIELVNKHVSALMRGETIQAPIYNFKTGLREPVGKPFFLPPKGIVVMEGIHALNPMYTDGVPAEAVFKVYISPLSVLQVDDFNAIKTTNHRLLRRMCRDYLFRGHSVTHTLSMWERVRDGEHAFIFPHQNNADYVMNSGMEYELCILKTFLEPGLHKVTPDSEHFAAAQELLSTLAFVDGWDDRDVPSTSLLREFIGNGAFDEH